MIILTNVNLSSLYVHNMCLLCVLTDFFFRMASRIRVRELNVVACFANFPLRTASFVVGVNNVLVAQRRRFAFHVLAFSTSISCPLL